VVRRPACCFLALAVIAGCGGTWPKGSVAQVGQKLITQEQLDSLKAVEEASGRAPNKDSQKADYARFEQGLAEYLVTIEVLNQKAASLSCELTDQDVPGGRSPRSRTCSTTTKEALQRGAEEAETSPWNSSLSRRATDFSSNA